MRQPLFIPESMTALHALEELRRRRTSLAIVVDEHGGTGGLVTISGIAAAVLGDSGAESGDEQPSARRQPDGSWVVDARLPIDEFLALLGLDPLPEEERGAYHTVAGLVMHHLGRLPEVGDTMAIGQARFHVLAMEGNRIDSVSVFPGGEP